MNKRIDMDAVIAELQKSDGWLQGNIGASEWPNGAVCLRGAIVRVAATTDLTFRQVVEWQNRTVEKVVREQFADRVPTGGGTVIPYFNDHPDTTLNDVILVLEKARAVQDELA